MGFNTPEHFYDPEAAKALTKRVFRLCLSISGLACPAGGKTLDHGQIDIWLAQGDAGESGQIALICIRPKVLMARCDGFEIL